MTCPITYACYRTLQQHFFAGSRMFLYADVEEQFNDLKQELQEHDPDHVVLLLRGFFAVELIYRFLLPQAFIELTHIATRDAFTQHQFERSHQGMDKLIEIIEQTNRRVQVDAGVLDMTGATSNQEKKFQADSMRRVVPMLRAAQEAAECMKQGLDQRSKMVRVGELLGESLINGKVSAEATLDYIRTMLTITPDNPVTPWLKIKRTDSPE